MFSHRKNYVLGPIVISTFNMACEDEGKSPRYTLHM